MANNSHLLKRGRQKLEPISLDELAGDSTMTGFSDLFKIPTAAPEEFPRGFNPPEIANGPETAPPVSGGAGAEPSALTVETGTQTLKPSSKLLELRSKDSLKQVGLFQTHLFQYHLKHTPLLQVGVLYFPQILLPPLSNASCRSGRPNWCRKAIPMENKPSTKPCGNTAQSSTNRFG